MRTAIYTRVSKNDGSQDPENQLRELKVFCERQGWKIVEVYTDHASGRRSDRASFRRMMLDASKRKFDHVTFWAMDRLSREGIEATLKYLRLRESAFDLVSTGGPFGRDYQIFSARSYPGKAFLLQQETFQDAVDRRLANWDAAKPWVEGLATLFDATQDEVLAQFAALGTDAKEAESQYVQLPQFHRIAHKYLVTSAPAEIAEDTTPSDRWLPLLTELDQARITPEETLQGIARETLMAARRKGLKVTTWQECYASTGRVSLEDGKVRTLRREVTHAIHNAAKKAAYQLGKVWTRKTLPTTKRPRSRPRSED